MLKSVLYHITVVLSLIFFSCAGRNNNQSDKVFAVCTIETVSPYGCYQEIKITSNGESYLKSGLYSGSIKDETVSLDTVFSVDSFYLQKEDLKNVHNVIASILKKENIKGAAKTDTYRHKLFIDGVSKIDIYGLSKDLQELLKHVINYLPPSNEKCEFFELFKKSISSPSQ